ncbi:HlyD family type I secretion periplasmic adaptor subunit [Hydrogenovibrio marinus]|uniref:HlyD family type I secretion periplasmic adaptor subunit n=1 Tax=Hydrogenovibrio marinus TaxID=28885 RepID=UPI0004A76DEA|nr:HlyD family type I secretion periplasmic adaptor subunit [Hydrogenovibrio marinus]BBN58672.1 HlyD family type I secretion periplasmic adaptor subunit [Hydrogenovibrio marinus]
MKITKQPDVSESDLEFMSSLSQAALEKPTIKSQVLVWLIFLVIVFLIVWASLTTLDKIVRGEGKVVPSSQIQVVQNLEGGIVSNIFVKTGDKVRKGETLLKLDNTQYASSFGEAETQKYDLQAQSERLKAEAFDRPFIEKYPSDDPSVVRMFDREKTLYQNQLNQLETNIHILEQQIVQHRSELEEAQNQATQLKKSYELLEKEIKIMEPLVREGIASQVDLLKTRRDANDAYTKLQSTQISIPKLQSAVKEAESKQKEAKQDFQNKAQEKLNEVLAKLEQIENSQTAIEDKVRRTNIRSPVNGVINQLMVSTIGEVVKPGSDIIKIVPNDASLVLETKILPSDIGFVYPGLKAKIKFTAYDFAIYGGLEGTVENISADTIVDDKGNSFYIARIKTNKNHLGTDKSPLYLLPGMQATVDVVVGKQTIMDYLIKPIIKAKDLALRES